MLDGAAELEVPLPFSVDRLINEICVQKLLPLPDVAARKCLSKIQEESAMEVLRRISSTSKRIYNLSGYIVYMVNRYGSVASYGEAESIRLSSQYSSSPSSSTSSRPKKSAFYDSPTLKQFLESPCSHETPVLKQTSSFSCSSLKDAIPTYGPTTNHNVSPRVKQCITSTSSCSTGPLNSGHCASPVQKKLFSSFGLPTPNYEISLQSLVLAELEFRKLFMVYSYIGSNKLEDAVSFEDAIEIKSMKNMQMLDFEDRIWRKFGCHYCQQCDRAMVHDFFSDFLITNMQILITIMIMI